MAPERFEGDRGDAAVRLYAFGCMLFETLQGPPCPRDSKVAKMFAHANSQALAGPCPARGCPRPWRRWSSGAWPRTQARYGDARELARATAAAGNLTPRPDGPPRAVRPWSSSPTQPLRGSRAGTTPGRRPGRERHPGPLWGPHLGRPRSLRPSRWRGTALEPRSRRLPHAPRRRTRATRRPALPLEVTEGKKKLPVGALVALFVAVAAAAALILTQAGGGGGGGRASRLGRRQWWRECKTGR